MQATISSYNHKHSTERQRIDTSNLPLLWYEHVVVASLLNTQAFISDDSAIQRIHNAYSMTLSVQTHKLARPFCPPLFALTAMRCSLVCILTAAAAVAAAATVALQPTATKHTTTTTTAASCSAVN
jgi:hypothetical protein